MRNTSKAPGKDVVSACSTRLSLPSSSELSCPEAMDPALGFSLNRCTADSAARERACSPFTQFQPKGIRFAEVEDKSRLIAIAVSNPAIKHHGLRR